METSLPPAEPLEMLLERLKQLSIGETLPVDDLCKEIFGDASQTTLFQRFYPTIQNMRSLGYSVSAASGRVSFGGMKEAKEEEQKMYTQRSPKKEKQNDKLASSLLDGRAQALKNALTLRIEARPEFLPEAIAYMDAILIKVLTNDKLEKL